MNIPIIMPQMGQSVAEGTIIRWIKNAGDRVLADEVIVEIESDKINVEVGSPADGVIGSCLKQVGQVAAVGEIIGMIQAEGDQREVLAVDSPSITTGASLPEITSDWLSPYVMRLALQNNISLSELSTVRGTGRQGRITGNDLLHFLANRSSTSNDQANVLRERGDLESPGEVVPMTSMRLTIADHMVQSIRTSAHVTMVHAVDMTSVVALRETMKDAFLAAYGVKFSYTAVLLFVTARVLRNFPSINASVSGSNIVLRKNVNIGCAVALSDESLVVPVVHHADSKSYPEIARELEQLIGLARKKALRREHIEGGTFTISNFGSFGSLIGTPIINQPQVAILGVGAIHRAPVVVDNQICIRDQVYLSLTFDHRVIDGAMGGRFLNAIQTKTETLTSEDLNIKSL